MATHQHRARVACAVYELCAEACRSLRLALEVVGRFERIARRCHAVGANVFLEWPRHCAYWREPR
eukprot:12579933-Alexandrium_andersonii.AAC.1